MNDLINAIYFGKPPESLPAPGYVGRTFDSIIEEHPDYNAMPYCNPGEESIVVEIRLQDATLSCVVKDNICIEAYIFPDGDDA